MTKQLGTLYSDREDFERGSNLLKECMENKHISFAQGKVNHLMDSLKRAKKTTRTVAHRATAEITMIRDKATSISGKAQKRGTLSAM